MLRSIIITDKKSQRGEEAIQYLVKLGVNYECSPAVFLTDEEMLTTCYDAKKRLRITGYPMTKGEVGCFLAHKCAWDRVIKSENNDCFLILEDDAVIDLKDLVIIQSLARNQSLQQTIALLYINTDQPKFRRWFKIGDVDIVIPTQSTYGAAAYLINKETAIKLQAYSQTIFCPVDEFFNMAYLHKLLLVHTDPPLCSHPDDKPSVIGVRIKPRISNRRRLVRNCFKLFRKFMDGAFRLKTNLKLGLLFTPIKTASRDCKNDR
jgi:glycosyl transferase family 25